VKKKKKEENEAAAAAKKKIYEVEKDLAQKRRGQ